jgi:hypothetical protein
VKRPDLLLPVFVVPSMRNCLFLSFSIHPRGLPPFSATPWVGLGEGWPRPVLIVRLCRWIRAANEVDARLGLDRDTRYQGSGLEPAVFGILLVCV